jgi:NAD(P)H-dependent flavin oxidoreductase YrpB (nitropropane dioxygenase family)
MLRTTFTDLVGCKVPIQLAGMSDVGSIDLAVAVSRAGAFGMVPAGYPPQALDQLQEETSGMFGVNFLMPSVDRAEVVLAASKAKLVDFFYGDPDPSLVEAVHQGGALASWQVGSRQEALAAIAAGCDLIVAQGREAGGHVRGNLGLLTVLTQVLEAVEVPVLAAGGIGTARAMAAALVAGAAGVRVGTRFVAAKESGAHSLYVAELIPATADDTVLTETFWTDWPNAPHRVLRSSVEAARAIQTEPVGYVENGWGVPRMHPRPPNRETTVHIEAMALYAGESVDGVTDVRLAEDIVRELVDGAEQLLRRWRPENGKSVLRCH